MNSLPPTTLPSTNTFVPAQPTIVPQIIPETIVPQQVLPNSSITSAPLQNQPHTMEDPNAKRHRRSKHEQEGRIYQCECGKSYLSQPALNNHKKSKHPELNVNGEKRGRGRPRKYLPNMPGDFETNKYETFFSDVNRKKEEEKTINLSEVVNNVFNFLYKGTYAAKLYHHIEKFEENAVLKCLNENAPISTKEKKEKTADEVFYEYLVYTKEQANETYFTLIVKFTLLFRECFNLSKSKKTDSTLKPGEEASKTMLPETLPELCNEFYTEFMESNNFFGIEQEKEKNEIIEIIQHFCIWLFKSEYTKSKLSLAQ